MPRPRLCLFLAALVLGAVPLLSACETDAPESTAVENDTTAAETDVDIPADPETIIEGGEELLGDWVIREQAGAAPEQILVVSFTREGDYLVREEGGETMRGRWTMAGEDRISITDQDGTRIYAFDLDDPILTLTVPGSETTTVMDRYEVMFGNG